MRRYGELGRSARATGRRCFVPLADAGERLPFPYHHLFRDVPRRRLARSTTPEAVAALHRRAATWYAEHGWIADAVQHALAGRDWAQAAPLIEQHGVTIAGNGEPRLALGWLHGLVWTTSQLECFWQRCGRCQSW